MQCTEVPGDCDVQRGKVAGRKSEKLENLLEATSCTVRWGNQSVGNDVGVMVRVMMGMVG